MTDAEKIAAYDKNPMAYNNPTTSAITSALIPQVGNIPGANLAFDPETNRASIIGDFSPDLRQQSALADFNSQFDTPYMDYANMGLGAINTIAGAIGTYDNLKTNRAKRDALKQNTAFAAQDQEYRTQTRNTNQSAISKPFDYTYKS